MVVRYGCRFSVDIKCYPKSAGVLHSFGNHLQILKSPLIVHETDANEKMRIPVLQQSLVFEDSIIEKMCTFFIWIFNLESTLKPNSL